MTNDQRPPAAHATARRRRWLPTYLQFRLAVLMFAIVLGFSGMVRTDPRLIFGAMGFGAVGVILRFFGPKQRKGS
jgi:hypothetical protein